MVWFLGEGGGFMCVCACVLFSVICQTNMNIFYLSHIKFDRQKMTSVA